jgi:hypothetical protein
MAVKCDPCTFEQVARVEFRTVREEVAAVRARTERLETLIARGTLLLVANLAGVCVMLLQALLSAN